MIIFFGPSQLTCHNVLTNGSRTNKKWKKNIKKEFAPKLKAKLPILSSEKLFAFKQKLWAKFSLQQQLLLFSFFLSSRLHSLSFSLSSHLSILFLFSFSLLLLPSSSGDVLGGRVWPLQEADVGWVWASCGSSPFTGRRKRVR